MRNVEGPHTYHHHHHPIVDEKKEELIKFKDRPACRIYILGRIPLTIWAHV